jgi:hypothetical protein
MRLCHETSKGLDLSTGQEPAICERRSQRSASIIYGRLQRTAIANTWPWQGTEEFLGLQAARGRVSVPP